MKHPILNGHVGLVDLDKLADAITFIKVASENKREAGAQLAVVARIICCITDFDVGLAAVRQQFNRKDRQIAGNARKSDLAAIVRAHKCFDDLIEKRRGSRMEASDADVAAPEISAEEVVESTTAELQRRGRLPADVRRGSKH